MSDINYTALSIMIVTNAGLLLITYNFIPKNTRRVYYLFSIISMFIFSGFGISYNEIGQDFLLEYIIFSTIFILTLFLGLRSNQKIPSIDSKKIPSGNLSRSFLIICTIIFYLTFVIFLIIPEVRLSQIWNPPSATVIGGYERIIESKNNPLLDLSLMVRTLMLPFYMVYLYLLKKDGKTIKLTFLILLWVYGLFLSQIYIGRYELVVFFTLLFVLSTSKKTSQLYISKKQLMMICLGFFLSIPALLSYQYSRMGKSIGNLTFGETFSELIGIELQFPSYYPITEILSNSISTIKYYFWFVLLPIPSIIFPDKGNLTTQLNVTFSSFILGVDYGDPGYYGLLPSILGEAILIYDENFYWIHAIFLGFMISFVCKLLEKNPELSILNLYFAVSVFSIARGGTQGYFGMVINSLLFYLLLNWLLISWKKRRLKV